jgi:hypothetical protein
MGDQIKKIDYPFFISALIITIVIFSSGYMIGWYLSKKNNNEIIDEINNINSLLSVLQILHAEEFCKFYPYIISKIEANSWKLGEKLQYIENQGRTEDRLKNLYFEFQYRDMTIVKKAISECKFETKIVIYFYTNKPNICQTCNAQGFELSRARNILKEQNQSIRIYSFDGELEGMGKLLANIYNVTSYPTIIYNNKKYGFLSKDELLNILK